MALIVGILLGAHTYAALDIPGGEIIRDVSIGGPSDGPVGQTEVRNFGLQILSFIKTLVSGLALIFIVVIGIYLVIYSDYEEEVSKQKKQFIYVLVGFLFLNIPTVILDVFLP